MTRAAAIALPLALAACATAPGGDALARFEAALAAQDSATAALEQWCGGRVTALPAPGPAVPPTARNRSALQVADDEPVGYRHVRLSCNGKVLSEAHNWYVPARLTAEMNRLLETTDTPFGRAIAPLGFTRERVASARGTIEGCPAETILFHRAILRLPDGRPVSTLIECYTSANLR